MAILFPRKLIYLDHPRTASTATQEALILMGGKPYKRHQTIAARGYRVSTIRNIYDLLISWWMVMKKREPGYWTDLSIFIKEFNNTNFTRNNKLFYFADESNKLLRYEHLEADLRDILKRRQVKGHLKLKKLNVTADKKHYQQYYSPKSISAVRNRFGAELEQFNHYV